MDNNKFITNNSIEENERVEAIYNLGQISSRIQQLYTAFSVTLENIPRREIWSNIYTMTKRDPVVSQSLQYKSVRSSMLMGDYKNKNTEIEDFVVNSLNNIEGGFDTAKIRIFQYLYNFGFVLVEKCFIDWKLVALHPLDPLRIERFIGSYGKPRFIVYNNGRGNFVRIPFDKCLHLVNSNIASFNEDYILGHGDGEIALNYYRLKKSILTQLAIASKNNSTGLLHVQTPNNSVVKLLDKNGSPYVDPITGKEIEFSKLGALTKQLEDVNSREYIVTEPDVSFNLLNIKTDVGFWQYVLNYVDLQIQKCYSIPVGVFDTGGASGNVANKFGEPLDATIKFTKKSFETKLINEVIKPLILFNFCEIDHKNNFGEFAHSVNREPIENIPLLNMSATLVASGMIDKYDPMVVNYFRKNMGMPPLNDYQVEELINSKASQFKQSESQETLSDMQFNLQIQQMQVQMKQMQMTMLQLSQQMQMLQNPMMAMAQQQQVQNE